LCMSSPLYAEEIFSGKRSVLCSNVAMRRSIGNRAIGAAVLETGRRPVATGCCDLACAVPSYGNRFLVQSYQL